MLRQIALNANPLRKSGFDLGGIQAPKRDEQKALPSCLLKLAKILSWW